MIKKLIWNDIKQNKFFSGATVFFMAVSATLTVLTTLLYSGLLGSINSLMKQAQVPDYIQMHTGALDISEISQFAENHEEIRNWQICRFLNLDNSRITLGGCSLADSTQDNGLSIQSKEFDYLLDMEGKMPEVLPGEVFVPISYRSLYDLSAGDTMEIGNHTLVIAGFLRDAQMNSMMASSKRFLINPTDYESIQLQGNESNHVQEEYLIEFLLEDGTDTNAFYTAYVAAGLPANGPAVTKPLIRMMNALSDGTMILIIFLMSIIILLISILCICFILSLQLEREKKEIGMLKALGIATREIRRLYSIKYLLFSTWGAFIGLLAAFILRAPLEHRIQELYGIPDNGLQAGLFALSAVLATEGIFLLSVRLSFRRTDRLPVLEALFPTQKWVKKPECGQYLLIGLVTAACMFFILIPQNLYSTMSARSFVTYMGIGDSEIRMDVRQTEGMERITGQITAALEQDIQVERYASLYTRACTAILPNGEAIHLAVETGDHTVFPVNFSTGMPPQKENEIALSSMNAEELGLSIGDTLQLAAGNKQTEYIVCGIYSDITNGGKTAKAYHIDTDAPIVWSVLYVSLTEYTEKEPWMEEYRKMGADVTDIVDYINQTYSQTLEQLRLAFRVSIGIAVSVIAMVILLFIRLIVERNRYSLSLHKALGFTTANLRQSYFIKGMLPVVVGILSGLVIGTPLGEGICRIVFQFFGVDGFLFTIDLVKLLWVPSLLLTVTVAAVWGGTAEISHIKAYECCLGKE